MLSIATIRSKLAAYGRVYGWLVGDVSRAMPTAVAGVVVLSVIGITTRLGAIAVVLAYVKALSSGADAQLAGVTITASVEIGSLAIWAGATLVLALLAAGTTYGAEWLAYDIASRYLRRAAGQVLRAFEAGDGPQVPNLPRYQEHDHVRKLLSRDLNMVLRATLILMRCVIPLATVIVAAIWLFAIHVVLTLIVVACLSLYAVPFFLLNAQVVRASHDRETHSREVGSGIRRLLPIVMHRRGVGERRRNWADVYYDMLPVDENLSALQDILLARKRVGLLQDVLFGVVLVASLVVFALLLADGGQSWAVFFLYLIALRFAAAAMKAIASFVTSSNRFVPQVRRYVEFIRNSRQRGIQDSTIEHAATVPQMEALTIRCDTPQPEDGRDGELVIKPGQPALIVNMFPLHVGSLRRWCRQLCSSAKLGDQLWRQAYYLGEVPRLPTLRLGELLAGDMVTAQQETAHIEAVFDQLGVHAEFRALPNGLETVVDASVDARMSRALRYACVLMEGVLPGREVLVLDWAALCCLPGPFIESVADVLRDRIVLLASGDLPQRWPEIAHNAVVVDDNVIGTGDRVWYDAVKGSLAVRWRVALDARAGIMQTRSAGALLDDDED